FDPVERNRLFIYDWTGDCLFAKWLGSRLAAPFTDFKFARTPAEAATDSLYALETENERKLMREYRWNGFGFSSERIVARAMSGQDGERVYQMFRQIGE
ncbi:MAG: hypothetical protein ACTSXZ_01095, partial [Alphaproteobacteria bacterium]